MDSSKQEIKKSLFIVWIVVSSIAFLIQLSPFVFNKQKLQNTLPVCESVKANGVECSMCGMTRSFISISDGNFSKADEYNSFGKYLFGIFLVNLAVLIFVLIRKAFRINFKKKKLCKQHHLLSEY